MKKGWNKLWCFLLREWEINPPRNIQDPAGIQTQDLSQTILPFTNLDPWQRSRRQATLTRGLSQIPTDSHSLRTGLNLEPWLNFATFKGPAMTHSPPSSPSSHNQGWWIHSLSRAFIIQEHLLLLTVNNIKPLKLILYRKFLKIPHPFLHTTFGQKWGGGVCSNIQSSLAYTPSLHSA